MLRKLALKQSGVADRTIALDVSYSGGSAWVCTPDCGVARLGGHGSEKNAVIEIDDATRTAGHDGIYRVGHLTASLPAIGGSDAITSSETAPTIESPPVQKEDDWPKPTAESLKALQGSWDAYQYGSVAWTLVVEGNHFRGVLGPDDWYEGSIRVRRDHEPAWIDFQIEDCLCSYKNKASRGIFRETGETIQLAAPQPGNSRPTKFSKSDGSTVELRRLKSSDR